MIFNYDKASGTFGLNGKNLKNAGRSIKDFFTKKQDIAQKYTLNKNEKDAFAAIKERLSQAQLSTDSEENRIKIADVTSEFTGANSALTKYAKKTNVAEFSQEGFAQSQQKVIQGTTKFKSVLTSVGNVVKSVGASMLSMGISAVCDLKK